MTKLKEIRLANNSTQKMMCEKTGISLRTYQRIESGMRTPNVTVAQAIANILNTTVEALFSSSAK